MFERFTDRARRIVVLSQEEAREWGHNYIGTEHLLLALVREGEGVACQALTALGVDLAFTRAYIEERVESEGVSPTGHIPFTPRAKKVFELSLREALQLGHSYIGTEHILLGLIREGEGVAAKVLVEDYSLNLSDIRWKIIEILTGKELEPNLEPAIMQGVASAASSIKTTEERLADLVPAWTVHRQSDRVTVTVDAESAFIKSFSDGVHQWDGATTHEAMNKAIDTISRAQRLDDLSHLLWSARGLHDARPVLINEIPLVNDVMRAMLEQVIGRALEEAHCLGYTGFDQ